ncbi:unnamed protein product, partial [Iphiclides podalirius]
MIWTSRGTQMLLAGGFRFSRDRVMGCKTRWQCTTKSRTKLPIFGMTKSGNPVIMVGPYRFNKVNRCKGPKVRWTCVKTPSGCRASITTVDDVIIRTQNEHNH